MSQLTHARPQVLTLRSKFLAMLLVLAVVATGTVLLVSSDDTSSSSSQPASQSIGGPNEAARGAAVAEASGAQWTRQSPDGQSATRNDGSDHSGARP